MIAFNEVLQKHGQAKKMSRMGYSIGVGYPPDCGAHASGSSDYDAFGGATTSNTKSRALQY